MKIKSYKKQIYKDEKHQYHQLVLPSSGRLEMEIERHNGLVSMQQAALIAAGVKHSYCADKGDNRFIVADIPTALAPDLSALPPFIVLDDALKYYLLFLEQELSRAQHKASTQRELILLLINLLTERYGDVVKVDRRLETARHHMDTRLDQAISLTEVALVAHLSVRQLNELFRRYFGVSPQQYLLEQRMQLAQRLLADTAISTQQVAERCGYSNLSAFSSRFSHYFGCSPRKFRNNSA